ncbi:hypothetical protein D3C80_1538470 [compost metagenome]
MRLKLPKKPLPLLSEGKRNLVKISTALWDRQLRKAHAFRCELFKKQLALRQGQANEAFYQFHVSVIRLHLKLPQARS